VPLLSGFAAERLVLELVQDIVGLVGHLSDLLQPSFRPFPLGCRLLLSVDDDVEDWPAACA
jgi:hypothetical protein